MKRDINYYEINDEVDVFPSKDSVCQEEFTGRIISINTENEIISIEDQEGDIWDMSPSEIHPTHDLEEEEDFSKLNPF